MKKNNYNYYISGKIIGLIYLGFAMVVAVLEIYLIKEDLQQGRVLFIEGVMFLNIVILLLLLQFARWFFYSLEVNNQILKIKKLFRYIEFEKSSITSVYSIDLLGTVIEYDDKKVVIPTSKSKLYQELGGYTFVFSRDVRFERMRKKGYLSIRPKWYVLLVRCFYFLFALAIMLGGIIDVVEHKDTPLGVVVFFCIVGVCVIWWFNRSFVYINEDFIWQGLFLPRVKHDWNEFDRYELKNISNYRIEITILKLYYKDQENAMRISAEESVLNLEDLLYLLELKGIKNIKS